jgi:site-specific DNA recombinase
MRIATYTRISTDEERQPFSLAAQAERLAAYVKSQDDWSIVARFTDQASGKSLNRPGLIDMLQMSGDGGFDLLLVYKVDRISRSVRALAQILEELDAASVAFRSATEPFDTSTAAGRMMVQMLGVFAEFERASIVERTRAGLSKKASKGEWTGGTPPFGYGYDKERRSLFVADEEAKVVQQIFRRYVLRRQGTAALSGWLNDQGLRTRRGNCWSPQKVIDILRNVTHIGFLPYNGEVFQSNHVPIVDEEVFEAAQAILKERAENYPLRRGNASDYLLTGTMQCKNCGHGFIGTDSHGKGGKYRYYTCYVRQRHGTARCDQYRIPAPPIEQGVIASVISTLKNSPLLREAEANALSEWKLRTQGKDKELKAVEEELRKNETVVRKYMRSFESGRMSERIFTSRTNELEKRARELEELRLDLMTQIEAAPSLPPEDLLNEAVTKLEATISNGEPETLKGLLRALLDRVEVDGREHIQPFIRLDGVLPSQVWVRKKIGP